MLLRIGTSGETFVNKTLGFHRMWRISLVAGWLLASQEEICFKQLVTQYPTLLTSSLSRKTISVS
jgi:hypothetical protein